MSYSKCRLLDAMSFHYLLAVQVGFLILQMMHILFSQQYYDDCHGIMYVIDSSDKARIEESMAVLGEY